MTSWTLAALLLLALAVPVAATPLGQLAASMNPGEWRRLTGTVNHQAVISLFSATPGYCDSQAWNSRKRQFVMQSAEHVGASSGSWPKVLVTYDDETNTWSTAHPSPGQFVTFHCYDHVAWDDANEVLYFRGYSSNQIRRYCFNATPSWCASQGANSWALLPLPNVGTCRGSSACQVAGAIAYAPWMDGGSLLYLDSDHYGVGGASLRRFRESTGTWDELAGPGPALPLSDGSGAGSYHNVLECSDVRQVCIFGGGNGSRKLFRINASKTITQITSAPRNINLGTTSRNMVADPVSGNFIWLFGIGSGGAGELWELNPTGSGTWSQLDADLRQSGEPCQSVADTSSGCTTDMVAASVSTYGILLFWKFNYTASEVWIYKHAPAPPPTQPAPPSDLAVR
jgi:hypothetical protein